MAWALSMSSKQKVAFPRLDHVGKRVGDRRDAVADGGMINLPSASGFRELETALGPEAATKAKPVFTQKRRGEELCTAIVQVVRRPRRSCRLQVAGCKLTERVGSQPATFNLELAAVQLWLRLCRAVYPCASAFGLGSPSRPPFLRRLHTGAGVLLSPMDLATCPVWIGGEWSRLSNLHHSRP